MSRPREQQVNVCPVCGLAVGDWAGKRPWNLERHLERHVKEGIAALKSECLKMGVISDGEAMGEVH